jgi:ubiquinone/menaquinone biosynthesis C-methylase UbiE
MKEKNFMVDAFSEIASHYEQVVDGELKRFWGWSYDGFIDHMIQQTTLGESDRVLDIASGTAVIPLKLEDQGKKQGQIIGLDLTYDMLHKGKQKIEQHGSNGIISLVCGNAMAMPFRNGFFDVIVCGLATHHLNVGILLSEMQRLLRPGGRITIADVGGASVFRKPVANTAIKTATFLYFLPKEGYARARVEADAVSNVLTPEEWHGRLTHHHFKNIRVEQLPRKQTWVPAPLMIRADKPSLEAPFG